MTQDTNIMFQAQNIIEKNGCSGYERARKILLSDKRITPPLRTPLRYLIETCWPNKQHPSLISLSYQAVGGKQENLDDLSASMVLLTGAADIHDDILDKSKTKGPFSTPFKTFGIDPTLLAGDILLLKALVHLSKACEKFNTTIRQSIRFSVESAFIELGCAVARERALKGSLSINPKEYRRIIQAKGAVSEACARIGVFAGKGTFEETQILGHFGRTLGVLMTLKHEFANLQDPAEMTNRLKNEILPLPVIYALDNQSVKKEILDLLKKRITKVSLKKLDDLLNRSQEVIDLKEEMLRKVKLEENRLKKLKCDVTPFNLLLSLSVVDL